MALSAGPVRLGFDFLHRCGGLGVRRPLPLRLRRAGGPLVALGATGNAARRPCNRLLLFWWTLRRRHFKAGKTSPSSCIPRPALTTAKPERVSRPAREPKRRRILSPATAAASGPGMGQYGASHEAAGKRPEGRWLTRPASRHSQTNGKAEAFPVGDEAVICMQAE